jgi:hypothetical protein
VHVQGRPRRRRRDLLRIARPEDGHARPAHRARVRAQGFRGRQAAKEVDDARPQAVGGRGAVHVDGRGGQGGHARRHGQGQEGGVPVDARAGVDHGAQGFHVRQAGGGG